ncbi:hypothetical protein EON65_19215 [archaeon]|nr:MAG: hypothetical protein EON65_19215 [archaeon]
MEEADATEEESIEFLEESVVLPMEAAEKLEMPSLAKDFFRQIVETTLSALSIQVDDESLSNMTEDRTRQIENMIVEAIQELQVAQTINLTDNAASTSPWIEFAEEHPLATNDINSPVILNVLSTWTTNSAKKNFFIHWVNSLGSPYDNQSVLPLGIQITGVSKVLRYVYMYVCYNIRLILK